MEIRLALEQSERWLVCGAALVDGLDFASSERNRVAASLFHLCTEHQQAIHTLASRGLIGSAFALLRPQFEAYVRGVWYHRCASDDDISAFLRGKEPPKIGRLLADIACVEDFNSDSLISTKKVVWKVLNEFTHGGTVQVRARMTNDGIVRAYKPGHVVGMLRWSAIFSLLGYVGMTAVAESDALAVELRDRFQSLYPVDPTSTV